MSKQKYPVGDGQYPEFYYAWRAYRSLVKQIDLVTDARLKAELEDALIDLSLHLDIRYEGWRDWWMLHSEWVEKQTEEYHRRRALVTGRLIWQNLADVAREMRRQVFEGRVVRDGQTRDLTVEHLRVGDE